MKLTRSRLKELIVEELKNIIQEDVTNAGPPQDVTAARQHRQQASVPIASPGGPSVPPTEGEVPPEQALKGFAETVGAGAIKTKFSYINAKAFPAALEFVLKLFVNPGVKNMGEQAVRATAVKVIGKVFGRGAVAEEKSK